MTFRRLTTLSTLTLAAALATAGVQAAYAADTSREDKKFVEDSGEGSLFEIQAAKLALQNSTNSDVRAFAQRMIKDHTNLIKSMEPFAKKMGVPAPTPENFPRAEKDEYQRLSGKKGESFDKDYIATMIDDHHKDLADFEKERTSTSDAQLKSTVALGEDVIKQHTHMIDDIAHKYNLPAPNTP